MKQCPFCKAQIEDNARFCLYCMSSLEEKQAVKPPKPTPKEWHLPVGAVLVLVILAGLVWKLNAQPVSSPVAENTSVSSLSGNASHTETAHDPDSSEHVVPWADSSSVTSAFAPVTSTNSLFPVGSSLIPGNTLLPNQSPTSPSVTSSHASSATSSKPTVSRPSTTSSKPSSTSSKPTVNLPITNNSSMAPTSSTKPTPSVPSISMGQAGTITPPSPLWGVYSFLYYEMERSDRLAFGAAEDAITIYSFAPAKGYNEIIPPQNRHYIIPETFDGKPVGGFGASDPSMRALTLPASVKYLDSGIFMGSSNLTDLYVRSKELYITLDVFLDLEDCDRTVTIHCPADCTFMGDSWQGIADSFDSLEYVEWNG